MSKLSVFALVCAAFSLGFMAGLRLAAVIINSKVRNFLWTWENKSTITYDPALAELIKKHIYL
jgi:hypothetical protein